MKRRILLSVALLGLLMGMVGTAQADSPAVTFQASDEPGSWFECTNTHKTASKIGCAHKVLGEASVGKSLAVINLGETIAFSSAGQANTLHTAVDLLYPTPASGTHTPFDVDLKPGRGKKFTVTPTDPGLHVYFCDIHPYMFAAVIVNDPKTEGLDLGDTIDLPEVLATGITKLPVTSNLALRLVHTFFIVTNPTNWQSFPATGKADWNTSYPAVPVHVGPQGGGNTLPNLDIFLRDYFKEGGPGVTPATRKTLAAPSMKGKTAGVGQVWVDTQFEKVTEKTKPGTATAVNAESWEVERKVALPHINMNNPHNMWTDKDQELIYQTQWFDNTLAVFKRTNGHFLRNIQVGPAPAHVMTRTNNDQVHVSLNGGNDVVELAPHATHVERNIPMSDPSEGHDTHPHGHWMSADGTMMVTPNPDTEDSTLYDFEPFDTIGSRTPTGHHSLATSMMPDSSKYYVVNFLDSTISVIKINANGSGKPTAELFNPDRKINLLANYNAVTGVVGGDGNVGGLPIQTPVSPDGKFMVTANTLTGTITIVNTETDKVVKTLECDPGCHGVQFGAKKGGGYYAYVASKFSNRMIVVDPKDGSNAEVVGHVLLTTANKSHNFEMDGTVSAYAGMGGQGVLPIPLVYNGWVQKLPSFWTNQLKGCQLDPISAPCKK